MGNVVITSAGLSQAITAGGADSNGPLFPIKYFLLVYDPRIDSNIHTVNLDPDTDVQAFSATSLSSDSSPVETGGHIIYNESGYTLSDAEHLIVLSGATETSTNVSGTTHQSHGCGTVGRWISVYFLLRSRKTTGKAVDQYPMDT